MDLRSLGGGARVGGKPYIETLLAVMAYLILRRYRISPEIARKIPGWLLGVSVFGALASAIGIFFPYTGNFLGRFYSPFYPQDLGVEASESQIILLTTIGVERLSFLANPGAILVLYIVSGINPAKLIAPGNLRSLGIYVLGVIMILLSGFRSNLTGVLLYTTVSVAFREKFVGVVKIFFCILTVMTIGIIVSYTPFHLPFAVQRALSFLPGHWDVDAVKDAANSNDWRMEMWKTVLTSDKYIHNKILGDGFGFLREDYEKSLDLMQGTVQLSQTDMQQEMFMINGDLHSGPVTSIRFVGYVGLALFYPMLVYLAMFAYKILNECMRTPFQFYAFFIVIPILIWPFSFLFIFGDYKTDISGLIFTAGILKMLQNSVTNYKDKMRVVTK